MGGVFDAQPTTVKTNASVASLAVDVKKIPEIVKNNSNVEIVKELQKYGSVRVVPPPEEFRGPGLNEMKKLELVIKTIDSENKVENCTIKLTDRYATVEVEGERKTLARDDNTNIVDLYKNTTDLTRKERKASISYAIDSNPETLKQVDVEKLKEFNIKNFKNKDDVEKADRLAETDKKGYLDFIKNKGLYDQFLNFVVRELGKMVGSDASKGGDIDAATSYDQGNRLSDKMYSDLREQVEIAKGKAPKDEA